MIHDINPIAFHLGLPVRWYGLAYLTSYLISAYVIPRFFIHMSQHEEATWPEITASTLLCGIIGGRVGHVLLYDWQHFINDPTMLFAIWNGGLSIHGGIIGSVLYLLISTHKKEQNLSTVLDRCALCLPFGLFLGRIGNFLNSECIGKVTDAPWHVIFTHIDAYPRHPSQLYEAITEGLFTGLILWYFYKKQPSWLKPGGISALFCLCYATSRFICEFWRVPDGIFSWKVVQLSYGQIYSVPLAFAGIIWLVLSVRANTNMLSENLKHQDNKRAN